MEIRAEELRIGNYVIVSGKNSANISGIIKVEDVLEVGINLCHDCWLHDYKDIQPIPLTEEILINSGFSLDKENEALNIFVNSLKITVIDKLGKWMIYLSGPFGMVILNSLKYLHELQNLIYSISGGQELNVKLHMSNYSLSILIISRRLYINN